MHRFKWVACRLSGLTFLGLVAGCGLPSGAIDLLAVSHARSVLAQQGVEGLPFEDPGAPLPEDRRSGSVFVGELLAFFPGLLVPGLGHYYAGDYATAGKLFRVGEFGYFLTAVGVGTGLGGYYLDRADQKGLAYSLYATGGVVSLAGVSYVLTAWIYGLIDTPRAVRSGGLPPARSEFIDSLDIFR